MTCREIVDFLMAYLDRELPADQRVVFEEHLNACGCCVKFMKAYEATVRLAQSACHEAATERPPEKLIQAILAARKGASGPGSCGQKLPPSCGQSPGGTRSSTSTGEISDLRP
jgi:anti-sigma factor RsiW